MGNIENLKRFLVIVSKSRDWIKCCIAQKKRFFKIKFHNLSFQNEDVQRLTYFQYENINILVLGKRNATQY